MSIGFDRAAESFLSILQREKKALNTIVNYRCDLKELKEYCEEIKVSFKELSARDLENYLSFLKKKGLKVNSRRRKLMTARKFIRHVSKRIDIATVGIERCIPPEKVERPPKLFDRALLDLILESNAKDALGIRNEALVRVLLDTGMLVTEALSLKIRDLRGYLLKVEGKRSRTVVVSSATAKALQRLSQCQPGKVYFFYGYTKGGVKMEKLTPRGVELLFKKWSQKHSERHLKPRTLRHLYIVEKLRNGVSENEIMSLVGLRTPYAFRVYRELVSQKS